MTFCPCQSGRDLGDCCGAIIAGIPAASPEALMRARYTAFLQGDMAFLEATLAPEKLVEFDRIEVEESAKDAQGLGFEVRATGSEGDEGAVEYIARFRMRGQPYLHHEIASFRRDNGVWLYVDGEVDPKQAPREAVKIGRNDPCPCGSGRKYKKCCGA
jgi:SEC-C motif-containing protein